MTPELEALYAQKAALNNTINILAQQPIPRSATTEALLKANRRQLQNVNAQIFILETGDYEEIPF